MQTQRPTNGGACGMRLILLGVTMIAAACGNRIDPAAWEASRSGTAVGVEPGPAAFPAAPAAADAGLYNGAGGYAAGGGLPTTSGAAVAPRAAGGGSAAVGNPSSLGSVAEGGPLGNGPVPIAPGAAGGGDNAAASRGDGTVTASGGTAGLDAADGTTATTPARYDQGADDKTIRLASISSMSGLLPGINPYGARAYWKYVNQKLGGINGRKIDFRIYDDQFDVARHAALVRQAFEQDQAFAFNANMAHISVHGGRAYYEQNNIPVIGGEGVDLKFWPVSPMAFPVSELEAIFGGEIAGREALEAGCQRIAELHYNIEESAGWGKSFRRALQARGQDYVYSGENSMAETDFSSYALAMKNAQADCFTVGEYDTSLVRIRQALKDVGWRPRFIGPSTFYAPGVRDSGLFEGDLAVMGTDILEDTSNPAIKEFNDIVAATEPQLLGKVNSWVVLSYVAAKVAHEALRRAGNDLTRANVVRVLNSITNLDVGLAPPITFRPGPHAGSNCAYLIGIENAQFRVVKPKVCV